MFKRIYIITSTSFSEQRKPDRSPYVWPHDVATFGAHISRRQNRESNSGNSHGILKYNSLFYLLFNYIIKSKVSKKSLLLTELTSNSINPPQL